MRLGPANIEGALLDLRNGSEGASLTVTASSATARISGVVRDAAGPAAYARVAMMLEEIPHTERVLSAGAGGVYTFVNISPGRYKLLALDAGVVYGLAIRDQLEDYADLVETVEVHPGDRLTLDLRRRASNSAAK
jgi:hypothetical protein